MTPLETFFQQRDDLRTLISEIVANDPRFVAGWLGGSFGRNQADQFSDLDFTFVVADSAFTDLCAYSDAHTVEAAPLRLALFEQFGRISLLHEYHNNASEQGTMSTTIYLPNGVVVDWVLLPIVNAQIPHDALLLFDEISLPKTAAPSHLPATAQHLAANIDYFWMMATVLLKYLMRGDTVFVIRLLDDLTKHVTYLEAELASSFNPTQTTRFAATSDQQVEQLHTLCQRVKQLSPIVAAKGGKIWHSASLGVDRWLEMTDAFLAN